MSHALSNALIQSGLPEQYYRFIVEESFNAFGDKADLRKRLLNYSNGKEQHLEQSASHVAMPSKSFARVNCNNESRKDGKKAVTCYVCRILRHIARDSRKKEGPTGKICKQKGHRKEHVEKKAKIAELGEQINLQRISLCCF